MLAALELAAAAAHLDAVSGAPREPGIDVRTADIADLVSAAQRGHRAAFAALYERFARVVHAIALARVLAGDADDVVQDVFAEAWVKLPQLREPAAFPGWLLAIARNRATDHARRRRPTADVDEAATSSALAVPQPPRAEAAAALRAIRELPETYRETLIMRLVEELSGPEIAERTGMTPESVRVHLHRGIKLLRERLGARDVDNHRNREGS